MSFAAGFQAGSGAVERGLRLRAQREETEKAEAYQAAVAGLSQQYQAGQQLQADYQAQGQANLDAGMALASPAVPTGAGALLNNAVPNAMAPQGAQMSPVAPQAGGLGGAGAMPQAAMMTPPPATSYQDYQRDMAALAMQYGDTATGMSLMGQAAVADRNEQLDAIRRSEFAQTQGLAQQQADLAGLQYKDTRGDVNYERTFAEGQRQATRELLMMVNQGKPMTDIQDFIIKNEFLDGATAMTTVTNAFNLNEAEVQAEQNRIRDDVADMTWEELKQAHIKDENISKGEHYDIVFNEESGLYDVVVFDTNNVTNETEDGQKTYAQKRVLGSTEDFGAAVNDLRTLAYSRGTAVESLTNKAVARRGKAAEAAIKAAERALEKHAIDTDFDEVQLKEVGEGIRDLRKDMTFASLSPADQQARIKGVYDSLGIKPPSTVGIPDVDENETPPPKGAGLKAIEAAQTAREEREKGERTVTSEAEEILGYKTGRGLFGSADEELFNAGYEAASPEVKAEIGRLIQARADREAAGLKAIENYGQMGIF